MRKQKINLDDSKMKIAIFSDNFYPEISGISDSIIILAKELAKRGYRINFYVPRYSKNNFKISSLPYKEIDLGENIEVFRLYSLPYPPAPTGQGRFVIPILSSYRHIKKFNPDVIYAQDVFPAGIEALILSKILKKPLLGTNHTPITEFIKYAPPSLRWIKKISLKYVSWYYTHCEMVTTPNKTIIAEMKENGFKGHYKVVSNPIEINNFVPYAREQRQRVKKALELSNHTVIYTGRLAFEKHIDVTIRAIALVKTKFPDVNLVLTGFGNAESQLRKLSKELGTGSNVRFFGFVESGKKYVDLYNACEIFAVTSTAEMQCLGMMQAMACALPVIAVDALALPEYVNSKNGYVIDVGDYKGLAEKIIYLFQNEGKISELGNGGLEYVKNFSSEKISRIWEEIFLSAMENRNK